MACARLSAALHGDADQRAAAYAELTALASGNSPDVTIGLSGATINIERLAWTGGTSWCRVRTRVGLIDHLQTCADDIDLHTTPAADG